MSFKNLVIRIIIILEKLFSLWKIFPQRKEREDFKSVERAGARGKEREREGEQTDVENYIGKKRSSSIRPCIIN